VSRKTSKERKKEIVKATLELVGEEGLGSLRTSQIADRVGFSEAALYKHFSDKKEVLRAAIDTAGEDLMEALIGSIEGSYLDDNLYKLKKAFETHMRFIRDHPGVTRLLFSEEVHVADEDLRHDLFEIITGYKNFIVGLLERAIEEGEVREDLDLDDAFTLYFGMIQSQILFWSLSGRKMSLESQVDDLWNLYIKVVEKEKRK